jgi:outer membrane biosynthesis protein TonB
MRAAPFSRQGAVTVQFLVREDGSVTDLRVIRGEAAFANPVINELRAQRYKPAMRKGRPVLFAYLFEATFTMTVIR